jgi:hypothetical protein
MKPDHDLRIINLVIGLAGLLVGLIGLMVSLHLSGYVIVALLSGGIGASIPAVHSRWHR